MKNLLTIIFIIFIAFTCIGQTDRMNNNYITAISLGLDPNPLFNEAPKGGLDVNAKIIFGKEHRELGLNAEYFHNLDYLSIGAFYDAIILGQGTSNDYYIQGLLGVELILINRFNGANLDLDTGFFGLTGGINGTLRWNITDHIGIEGILNWKYARDKKVLWDEKEFHKLFPLNGRLNLIFTFK